MGNTMKYKINDTVEFKANSLSSGKIVMYEKASKLYTIELSTGGTIRCTEHYIND